MPAAALAPSPAAHMDSRALRHRILQQARRDFFAHGYSRFTMDGLAEELGVSKKTLYVHFAGKDEIVGAVIDDLAAEIRADADALLRDRTLNLAEKLRSFVEGMLERMAPLNPHTVRDLQRFAPRLFAKVAEVRGTTLPYVFGRFTEEGQIAGLIRTDLPPGFAVEFFLQAMQGMMHPATLERLGQPPARVIAHGIDLFFGGLLTHAGRKQYEKLFPR
jgi:AcrR family transcriptional regulator